jgi:succinate dehydrogenase subunit C
MSNSIEIAAGAGPADRRRKSAWPARMDFWQSATGLLLALFMWAHMFFVASILISEDAMWTVTRMFEGYFIFGNSYPVLVSGAVGFVLTLFTAHAFLAMRKFPASFRQYRAFTGHMAMLRHRDTTLWWVQFMTGFLMLFLASAHLYQMLTNPGDIGPYASGARVFHSWWPLYLVLLVCVELHGSIGLYRLAMKWGWFEGKDPDTSRKRLATAKTGLSAFFLVLGLLTLAAYFRIGWEHRNEPDVRYIPAGAQDGGMRDG